jgi:hypothetical protein
LSPVTKEKCPGWKTFFPGLRTLVSVIFRKIRKLAAGIHLAFIPPEPVRLK